MPLTALLLALGAAATHAAWNLLTARAEDPQALGAVALAIGVVVFLPVALVTGTVERAALPYAAASIVLEIVYFRLLMLAYARGPLSLVYPIARGAAPVLVLAAGLTTVTGVQAGGVVLVGLGVLAVRGGAGGRGDVGLALAVAATIAGYTLVDKHGLDHADPLPYLVLVLAPAAAAGLVLQRARPLRAQLTAATAVAGIGMLGAYGLTLAALARAAAAPVAAVRETSVVIGVVLARAVLGEPVTRARVAGAVVVSAGIALVALG